MNKQMHFFGSFSPYFFFFFNFGSSSEMDYAIDIKMRFCFFSLRVTRRNIILYTIHSLSRSCGLYSIDLGCFAKGSS